MSVLDRTPVSGREKIDRRGRRKELGEVVVKITGFFGVIKEAEETFSPEVKRGDDDRHS
jgi:hypothetical protein